MPDAPVKTCLLSADECKALSLDELFQRLGSSSEGLSDSLAKERLLQCGPNVLEEKKKSAILNFLSFSLPSLPPSLPQARR